MKIGFIGAGRIGTALARKFILGGHQVILSNSRGKDSLTDIVDNLGPLAIAAEVAEAAKADIIVVSVRWNNLQQALQSVPDWTNKIVIDTNNQILKDGTYVDLNGRTSSEIFSDFVPGAKVIKAFNHLFDFWISSPAKDESRSRIVFLSGDDKAAKQKFKDILIHIGYSPLDLGGLAEGGKMFQAGEPLAAINLFVQI